MKKKSLYSGVSLLTLISLLSFTEKPQTPDFSTQVDSKFYSFIDNFRQEKLYLQTDKPYYSAGENIWFKGYLVNAATLKPESLSGFIYVELIDQERSVISRVKIQKDSTGFSGYIKLEQTIPPGDYNLRAYSQWMQNTSIDFFHTKSIQIGNRIEDAVNLTTTYGEVKEGHVFTTIKFTDEHLQPIPDRAVEIYRIWFDEGKMKDQKILLTTTPLGNVSFNLPIDTLDDKQKVMYVTLKGESDNFETKVFLPDFRNDFDLQFFPESGVLLSNGLQNVAFKAIGTDGMSREVSGHIYSQNGEQLSKLETQINGMGIIALNPAPGESYYVIVKTEQGVEKHFDLPKLEDEGVSLRLNFYRDKINYKIVNQLANQSTPLYLLIHSNGKPIVVSPINKLMGQISLSELVDNGIFSFSIIDTQGNVYCERLFFRNRQSTPTITMTTDKESYGKRELVNASFDVQSRFDKTNEGFYSLSVTDNQFVKPDTINDNIVSYLLLSSDLKGYIEKPTSYFTDDHIPSDMKLDLLMLTHGWRRYNTSDLLKDKLQHGDYLMEAGQTVSGKVVNYLGKPVHNSDVMAIVKDFIIISKTDSLGQFMFDGMGFQDSVSFVFRADKKRSLLGVKVIPNEDSFAEPQFNLVKRSEEQEVVASEYFDQSRLRFFTEGGIRNILLDEVTIKAADKRYDKYDRIFSNLTDTGLSADEMKKMKGQDIYDILATIPGIWVSGRSITIKGNEAAPIILIDGVLAGEAVDFIQQLDDILTTDNVESIQVFKGFGDDRAGNAIFKDYEGFATLTNFSSWRGAINFVTKKGVRTYVKSPLRIGTVWILGTQKPTEFYAPKYEVKRTRNDATPDLRTTLYWNPSMSSDSSGKVNVQFYTADGASNYSVVLEGVTKDGEVCRYEGVVELRGEN